MFSKNYLAAFGFTLSLISSHASAGLCDSIIEGARNALGFQSPLVLNFDLIEEHPDQGRNAVLKAAARGSNRPQFSSNQRSLIGRNISTGKDVLFVWDDRGNGNEEIASLPLDPKFPRWKSLRELGEGAYVLENGHLLKIYQLGEDDGGGYYFSHLFFLDFDPKEIVQALDREIISARKPLIRLALSNNRTPIMKALLEGTLRMRDLTDKVSFATSKKNFKVYVLIQSSRYPNSGWADLIIPVKSTESVGKAYGPLQHKLEQDTLVLDDGSIYEIENESYD